MADIAKFAEQTVNQLDTTLKDVRIPRANLGPCPVCGQDIIENRKGYSCWSRSDPGCGFVIWKSKAGKTLNTQLARELIKTGRTERPVTGFKSRAGKSFRSRLALMQTDEGRWRVEFDEPWAKEGAKPPEADDAAAAEGAAADAARAKWMTPAASPRRPDLAGRPDRAESPEPAGRLIPPEIVSRLEIFLALTYLLLGFRTWGSASFASSRITPYRRHWRLNLCWLLSTSQLAAEGGDRDRPDGNRAQHPPASGADSGARR